MPGLPAAVDAVIARGMAKAPVDRYPSCGAFMAGLRAALRSVAADGAAVEQRRFERRWTLIAVVGSGILAVAGIIGWLDAVGGMSEATPSVPPTQDASPSIAAQTPGASETLGAFPSQAEAALLEALTPQLRESCERGSYAGVLGDVLGAGVPALPAAGGAIPGAPTRVPAASLSCPQTAASGANLIQVKDFGDATNLGKTGFTTEGAVSGVAAKQGTTGGDCSQEVTRVNGRWERSGADAGAIVCFIDGPTGDAVIYWSYEDDAILVRAVNQRGDTAALYDFFLETARFIAP
jgi:hypothetical protein